MIDGELFDFVEELGPKQVSTIQLLDKAMDYCANASPDNFNLIAMCKTFVLQLEDQYDFISHVVLIIVLPIWFISPPETKYTPACMQYPAMNGSMIVVTSPIQAFLYFRWNESNNSA